MVSWLVLKLEISYNVLKNFDLFQKIMFLHDELFEFS
jgi:hypothetical protein